MRAPANLPLSDSEEKPVICELANVLYMFGLTQRPDPRGIERIMDHKLERGKYNFAALCFLLEKGFYLRSIHSFDRRRFVAEGPAYLNEQYPASDYRRRWTPKQVSQAQAHTNEELTVLAKFGDQWTHDVRTPELADIQTFVAADMVVNTTHGQPGQLWPVLVWGKNNKDELLTYTAMLRLHLWSSLGVWSARSWVCTYGITAIWRP